MERRGDEIHIETDEARSGETPHIVRHVLLIALVLAVLALSAIWITGAVTSPQGQRTGAVTNQATPRP
ncbi:hypothetical protein ACFOD9_13500 [Novosphingobium bradum]|uniref:Uncharacterized protein n=1 Tax=Novosphingobium bradum TaxID=1737444 RepID=A0ABV7IVJ6_9SPHN